MCGNASTTMIDELRDVLDHLVTIPDPSRCVFLVAGEEAVFCSGADLGYMKRLAGKGRRKAEDAKGSRKPLPTSSRTSDAGHRRGPGRRDRRAGAHVASDFVLAEDTAVSRPRKYFGIVPESSARISFAR
jgi:hypothetical protein